MGRVVEGVDVAQDPQLIGVREDARLGVVRVEGDDERAHEQERLDRAQDPPRASSTTVAFENTTVRR